MRYTKSFKIGEQTFLIDINSPSVRPERLTVEKLLFSTEKKKVQRCDAEKLLLPAFCFSLSRFIDVKVLLLCRLKKLPLDFQVSTEN